MKLWSGCTRKRPCLLAACVRLSRAAAGEDWSHSAFQGGQSAASLIPKASGSAHPVSSLKHPARLARPPFEYPLTLPAFVYNNPIHLELLS